MAFFGSVGWSIGSLAASPEDGDPGVVYQVPWAVSRVRSGSIQVHLHPAGSQESFCETFTPSSVSVFLLALRAEQSPGEDANFSQPLVGAEDVEQGGTDRNLEGDLCNWRTTEAEGTSGGHSVGPSLMLDEAAQGPVQSSYLQGWRSHQLPVPVFVMETFLFRLRLKFFWL